MKKNKTFSVGILGAAMVAGLALSGCSSDGHVEHESFSFSGDTLNVVHDNSYMPVSVSDGADRGTVTVEVTTQTMGRKPRTPAWSLTDGSLNLSTPCRGGIIGYCEGSYSIRVPNGTSVLVNGKRVAVD